MIRRTRTYIAAVAAGALGGIAPAVAVGQEAPDASSSPTRDGYLPFSIQPDNYPGPPRAMGLIPYGENLPPSQLANPLSGPPRAMGETPYRPYPSVPYPSPAMGEVFQPGQFPFFTPSPTPIPLSGQQNALLLLPALLGESAPAVGGQPGALPPALPEVPGLAIGVPETPRGAPRIDDRPPGPPLSLLDVRLSAERKYPPFLAALEERNVAAGELTSTRGAFDLMLNSDSRNYPLGYYDRTVQDLFFEQPVLPTGGKVFAGYRLGTGQFPTYYNYLNTRGGGAFVSGLELPLLRNRAIDSKRAKLYQAEIERRKVEPTILKERVSLLKNASKAYWNWVAAGQALAVYQDLVELTQSQLNGLIQRSAPEIGQVSRVQVIAFQNTLIKRQQQLVVAERDYQQASILLSFYLRDARGLPLVPAAPHIPVAFPAVEAPRPEFLEQDVEVALRLRPEVFSLLLQYDKARIDRRVAENLLLPQMNFYVYNEQNVGVRDADLGKDFRPNILETSIFFEMPLQRRLARGRIRTADAVLRQIRLETNFTRDQIANDVRSAMAELEAAYRSLVYYRNAEVVSRQLAEAERQRLEIQLSSPFVVFVILQQQVLDAQVLRVLAEGKYFTALAEYRAALGLDAVTPEVAQIAPPSAVPPPVTSVPDVIPPLPGAGPPPG